MRPALPDAGEAFGHERAGQGGVAGSRQLSQKRSAPPCSGEKPVFAATASEGSGKSSRDFGLAWRHASATFVSCRTAGLQGGLLPVHCGRDQRKPRTGLEQLASHCAARCVPVGLSPARPPAGLLPSAESGREIEFEIHMRRAAEALGLACQKALDD